MPLHAILETLEDRKSEWPLMNQEDDEMQMIPSYNKKQRYKADPAINYLV